MFGHGPFSAFAFADIPINESVSVTGVAGTGAVGSVTVTASLSVAVVGNEARGNEDLGGAFHAEYFVPTDGNDPNITVMAFEDSTTVSADGSSLGTISSAGGTLTVSASNYENKIISANKPITLQSGDNQTVGVPTTWAGTSFGFRNTRTGFVLQMRALYGTASVEIFKDGVSTTTLSVGSTATTTQSYADDTSDPEYTVFSDLPIIVFKTRDTNLGGDNRPAFPATTDFLYGTSSNNAASIRVDGYGATAVSWNRFDSNGGSASETISTVKVTSSFASGQDFTGPTNRIQAAKAITAYQIGDSDGGEKTSFIPEGCFAHEFRLIEAAEFVNFIGAPGTNGRNIEVYNSSGTLVDTIQLATSNTGSDFPTKFQLISSTTTDSNLTGNAKSYALTAGMRFVSEVPVGAVVEDESANRESNLFGVRNFPGRTTGTAAIAATGAAATGTLGSVTVIATGGVTVSATGVAGTGAVGDALAAGGAKVVEEGLSADVNFGEEQVSGGANIAATGVSSTGAVGSVTPTGASSTDATGVSATGAVGNETVVTDVSISVTGAVLAAQLGNETVSAGAAVDVTGVSATGAVDSVTLIGTSSVVATGVSGTSAVGDETAFADVSVAVTGSALVAQIDSVTTFADANITVTSVSATGAIGTPEFHLVIGSVSATGAIGAPTLTGTALFSAQGVDANTGVGEESVSISVRVFEDNVSATGAVGTVTATGTSAVAVTGVEGAGTLGNETIITDVALAVTGVSATASAGDETAITDVAFAVTAVTATAELGTALGIPGVTAEAAGQSISTALGTVVVDDIMQGLTGLSATASAGIVFVWGQILPDQVASWQGITPDQTAAWGEISSGAEQNWQEESPSSSPSWGETTPNAPANWKEVA